MEFNAAMAAKLDAPETSESYTYTVPFGIATAAASNVQRTDSIAVSGMRLIDGVWYAHIVGATMNKENPFPEQGRRLPRC